MNNTVYILRNKNVGTIKVHETDKSTPAKATKFAGIKMKLESAQPSMQISISEQKTKLFRLSSTSSNVGLPTQEHYMRQGVEHSKFCYYNAL